MVKRILTDKRNTWRRPQKSENILTDCLRLYDRVDYDNMYAVIIADDNLFEGM